MEGFTDGERDGRTEDGREEPLEQEGRNAMSMGVHTDGVEEGHVEGRADVMNDGLVEG